MKKYILRIILIILLLCTFYMIFSFSSQNGEESSGISRKVTEFIVEKILRVNGENKVELINKLGGFVRKLAHFSIYAVVGFLLMALVSTYSIEKNNGIGISLIIGIIYAISDEIHQYFVPGRAAKITDVMIDTMGVIVGILILILTLFMAKKIKLKKVKE